MQNKQNIKLISDEEILENWAMFYENLYASNRTTFTRFEEEGSEVQRNFWEMSSFEESKASSFTSNDSTARQFLDYNVNNLSRIYPKGTRLFSSNLG